MSTLRKEMLQVMQQKNYCERTIKSYLGTLSRLSQYYKKSPDLLTVKEVNDYIYYCIIEKGLSTCSANQLIGAFKILTVNVLKREWVPLDYPRPRYEKRLPAILISQGI
jgi:integrase/recombinase XerD